MMFQVDAIVYEPAQFPDELYQQALSLLDLESSTRIKKFYRREDACRTLIGRFLPRMLLHARGVSLGAMEFSSTETGKPFITTQGIDPPIAFNVSHDNGLVVMASSTNSNIGIDVMKVSLPGRDTFISFVEAMGDQLTAHERQLVASALNQAQALEHFFWMWTAKEAYTKALGIGLGFNFRRVEFDPVNNILLVDGMVPKGWRFSKFVVIQGDERYQGVVAESVGGEETSILPETGPHEWLVVQKASNFIRDAVQKFEC